ncbi:hypothetical protein JF781_20595 [Mycobacterium sp. WUMAC-067]|nr:hypothetical protein [Mycobacterium sp. WUMAC-025]MCA2244762.1 hypothetical protein [Mycobacterium sp. WUMAC-067]MCA2316334.1 hypothetical protein [Mycobacterium sp. WUMAC-025]
MPVRQSLSASAMVFALLLGGCAQALHKPHADGAPNPYEDSGHPMSDDQTKAQVIEPAKQIVAAANLDGVSGAFSFASCNDQGDTPYQGTVTLSFLIHGDPDAYLQRVRAAMIAHGWNDGAPLAQHYHGASLNKDGVAASISYMPSDHSYGQIILDGQCRNIGNHKGEGKWVNINDQLAGH